MSDSASRLPARPSLEQLQKQAKELLTSTSCSAKETRRTLPARQHPLRPIHAQPVTLADAQFVLAREYGFENVGDNSDTKSASCGRQGPCF